MRCRLTGSRHLPRLREKRKKVASRGTPFAPLLEPAYRYAKAAFHGLRAASASDEERDVFAYRDGDWLFKVEAAGGEPESRREIITAAAEVIWKFRHSE